MSYVAPVVAVFVMRCTDDNLEFLIDCRGGGLSDIVPADFSNLFLNCSCLIHVRCPF